jgi:glycerol uptake facilitator-like aquaporin
LIGWTTGAYITAGYWFTSSTSFANPAVTIARMFSDTFAGIEPASVPMFLLAQIVGRRHRLRPCPGHLPPANAHCYHPGESR